MMGWPEVELGAVASVDWGNTSITKASYSVEGYPAFSAAGQDGLLPFYEHEGAALVVSAIGARCGKCFYADGQWTAIKNTIVVKSLNKEKVIEKFLFFSLNDEAKWPRSGSGQPFIGIGQAKLLKLRLPSCAEQAGIIQLLSSIKGAIQARERELEFERERKAALMAHLFTHGTRGEKRKRTEIGEMPESWRCEKLKGVIFKPDYGYTESATLQKVGPKFLRITDIQDGSVNWELVPFCVCDQSILEKKSLKNEDIVIARIGATTGKGYIIKNPPKAVFASYLIRIRAKTDMIRPKFLYHLMQTKIYWSHIEKNKGGKLKGGINIPILQGLPIPVPPTSEQDRIVQVLDAQEDKITSLTAELSLLSEFFFAALHQLMCGNLSVAPLLVNQSKKQKAA